MPWQYGPSRKRRIEKIAQRVLFLCLLIVLGWFLIRVVEVVNAANELSNF